MSHWWGDEEGFDDSDIVDVPSKSMTLCIAAVCETAEKIVTVSDFTVTVRGLCQFDRPSPKLTVFPTNQHRWVSLFSDDSSEATTVWEYARMSFKDSPEHKKGKWEDVVDACKNGFLRRLKEHRDAHMNAYHREYPDLGVKFILAGFDQNKRARFFRIEDPDGTVKDITSDGFGVTGGGWEQVSTSISSWLRRPEIYQLCPVGKFGYPRCTEKPVTQLDLEELIFRLCMAKFDGEVHPLVGKETFVTVHDADGHWQGLSIPAIEEMRKRWEDTKKMPDGMKDAIAVALTSATVDDNSGKLRF